MTKLQLSTHVDALVKGARNLLVVAAQEAFEAKRFPKVLDDALRERVLDLAKDVKPGDAGAAVTSVGGTPRQITVGVLPNTVSRYNAPCRAAAIRSVVDKTSLGGEGTSAVLLVLDEPAHLLGAANAVGRALPIFSRKSGRKTGPVRMGAVTRAGEPLRWTTAVKQTVTGAREAARLVDTPPTEMNPAAMVREARKFLRGLTGVRTRVIAGNELLRAKLRGLHAVGRTAADGPRLFVADCRPKGGASGRHVAIVGKGITFDTGGLNLKGRGGMSGMKADMGGAAAALGAFHALVAAGTKHHVSLVLCLAENAIGPKAYKPDDVLVMHSGKTVEINNTDAEGRIVLADGVSFAARVLKADTIFDAATLTGAQLVATGVVHAAVVSNEAELEAHVVAAGRECGDLVHPLPFAPELYQQEFASAVADMRNSVKNRANAQSSCAAQFIWSHLDGTGVEWCHVDLAGPAFQSDRATGFGVALLAHAVAGLGGKSPAHGPRAPRRPGGSGKAGGARGKRGTGGRGADVGAPRGVKGGAPRGGRGGAPGKRSTRG